MKRINTKVCHFTSAHETNDDRIFLKECNSLANNGFDVYVVGKGETKQVDGIHIIGCGNSRSRYERIFKFSSRIYKRAKQLECDIYHFHDPELLPYGLKLKKHGKKVIFDSHEDVPAQIMDKAWIPKPIRKIVSRMYKAYETHVVKNLDAVVAATPHIADQFRGRAKEVVVINNYPKLDDIMFHDNPFSDRDPIVCYAGGISEIRGEKIMVDAMKDVDGTLIMAGDHEIMEVGGGIKYIGLLGRAGINELYGRAIVGLCILKPIENYYYSQPIKIYEYMAAGLPFICSDFPGWRAVAEESGAGICVDPNDIDSVRTAIEKLLSDRGKAQCMGRKGREYVLTKCSWDAEEHNLLSLYQKVRERYDKVHRKDQ